MNKPKAPREEAAGTGQLLRAQFNALLFRHLHLLKGVVKRFFVVAPGIAELDPLRVGQRAPCTRAGSFVPYSGLPGMESRQLRPHTLSTAAAT